ncbi:TlpA family protein disulfide reductase [Sphingobacterium puteale]|uniref:TlpA family protein disulfide reductase n=1 Tax=Sphingobacterium puteale TaxID=2420510 RepID=UPI003D955EA3
MKNILIGLLFLFFYEYGYTQQNAIQNQLKALFEEKDDIKLRSALKNYTDSKEESGLIVAVNYYTYKNLQQTADSLKQIAVARFPQGDFAYSKAVEKFDSLNSYQEKIKFHHQIIKDFPGRDFSSFNGMLIQEAIENRDCALATETFARIENSAYIHYLIPVLCEKLMLQKETNDECLNAFLQSLLGSYRNILKGSMISENAPDITLSDMDGNTVSLASLKGKTVILDFWATWCKPCLESFPGMQATLNNYKDNPNIKFFFINTAERGTEDPKPKVNKIMDDNKYTFRVLMDKKDEISKRYAALESFKVAALPTKFIIDKDGLVRFKLSGTNGGTQFIQEEIKMMIDAISL